MEMRHIVEFESTRICRSKEPISCWLKFDGKISKARCGPNYKRISVAWVIRTTLKCHSLWHTHIHTRTHCCYDFVRYSLKKISNIIMKYNCRKLCLASRFSRISLTNAFIHHGMFATPSTEAAGISTLTAKTLGRTSQLRKAARWAPREASSGRRQRRNKTSKWNWGGRLDSTMTDVQPEREEQHAAMKSDNIKIQTLVSLY